MINKNMNNNKENIKLDEKIMNTVRFQKIFVSERFKLKRGTQMQINGINLKLVY